MTLTSQQNQKLQEALKTRDQELQQEREKVAAFEAKEKSIATAPKEHTWGADSGWGSSSGWGTNNTDKTHTVEEEKLW